MEVLYQYLLFLAETTTLLLALVVVVAVVAAFGMRERHSPDGGQLHVRRLNDHIDELVDAIDSAVVDAKEIKRRRKERHKQRHKQQRKGRQRRDEDQGSDRPRIFVIDFVGDIDAEPVSALRHEISAVLGAARKGDEVFVRLESGGGMVHAYGFAASQLARLRTHGVRLVVGVDKVAASGGYLMACIADELIAAPFAVIGSIGVVVELPNLHRLLKRHDIDVEVLTAGKYKRTLSTFGANTEEGRSKLREELEDVHALFKEFVTEQRPQLDVERVATGEAWHGKRALELKLVDRLETSDEYMLSRMDNVDLIEVRWQPEESPIERLLRRLPIGIGRRARLRPEVLAV